MRKKLTIITGILIVLTISVGAFYYLRRDDKQNGENKSDGEKNDAQKTTVLQINGLKYIEGPDYIFYYPETFSRENFPEAIAFFKANDKTSINLIGIYPIPVENQADCQERVEESETALEEYLSTEDDRVSIVEVKKVSEGCYEHLKMKMGSLESLYYIHSIQKILKTNTDTFYAVTIRFRIS